MGVCPELPFAGVFFFIATSFGAQMPGPSPVDRWTTVATGASTAIGPPCETSADCDDDRICTEDICTPSGCAHVGQGKCCEVEGPCADRAECIYHACTPEGMCAYPLAYDGRPCGDFDPCMRNGHCLAGTCIGDNACDDNAPCTIDTCVAGGAREFAPETHGCSYDRRACACEGQAGRPGPVERSAALDGLTGEYPFDPSHEDHMRETAADLGVTFFEIDEIAFAWSGGVYLAAIDCWGHLYGWGNGSWVTIDGQTQAGIALGTDAYGEAGEAVLLDEAWLFPSEVFAALYDGKAYVAAEAGWYIQECFMWSEPLISIKEASLIVRGYRMYDFECDGIVDLEDAYWAAECLRGPQHKSEATCRRFDGDRDGDVDLADITGFQREYD